MKSLWPVLLVVFFSCSHDAKKKSDEKPTPVVTGTHYTTLLFSKGKSELTRESKEHLKDLTIRAHKNYRPIEEIRILAWADAEYPNQPQEKIPKSQVILASERAQKIRDYLEEDLLENNDIDAYNMAKRPDILSKILRNDEYDVKNAFEASGTTGSRLPDGSVSYTKASKAIVIIDYEGTQNNLQ